MKFNFLVLITLLTTMFIACSEPTDSIEEEENHNGVCGNGESASFNFTAENGSSYQMVLNERTTFTMVEEENPTVEDKNVLILSTWTSNLDSDVDYYTFVASFLENFSVGVFEINAPEEAIIVSRVHPEEGFTYESFNLSLEVTEVERGPIGTFTPFVATFSGMFKYEHEGIIDTVEASGSFCIHEAYPR